jgi:cytochrome c oxidase subunit IV
MSDAHVEVHADDIRKEVKTYLMVFGALMVFTVITVAISYLHLAVHEAIIIALAVATVKGSLVALYFMHLKHERHLVYYALALTVVFFVFLMVIPLVTNLDRIVQKY